MITVCKLKKLKNDNLVVCSGNNNINKLRIVHEQKCKPIYKYFYSGSTLLHLKKISTNHFLIVRKILK
jgi:hypothetical protein